MGPPADFKLESGRKCPLELFVANDDQIYTVIVQREKKQIQIKVN